MTRDALLRLLATSPAAVRLALTTLYARQTGDERNAGATTHLNGQGFNATDATFASSLARQVEARRVLSTRQLAAARRLLPKYVGQLLASGVEWETVAPRTGDELRAMETLASDLQHNTNGGSIPPRLSSSGEKGSGSTPLNGLRKTVDTGGPPDSVATEVTAGASCAQEAATQ